jgi:hypothetical protein
MLNRPRVEEVLANIEDMEKLDSRVQKEPVKGLDLKNISQSKNTKGIPSAYMPILGSAHLLRLVKAAQSNNKIRENRFRPGLAASTVMSQTSK